MDVFLTKVTQQAMNYAIRSGITITASYAIRQSSRLLKQVDGADAEELQKLQERLQSKIRIMSPAIDMVELIAARGNTSLESAVSLTKELRWDIQVLGQRLAKIVSDHGLSRGESASSGTRTAAEGEIKLVIKEIRALLDRIEDAVPFINLAITTSGARLSTSLPQSVSPSRLLQASTFLTGGDTQYSMTPTQPVQVGPTFTLSIYLLFAGHARPQDEEGVRNTTWKEAIHKARVKLQRVPMDMVLSDSHLEENQIRETARVEEFAYRMLIIEDLDDDRVHTFDDDDAPKPGYFEGVSTAGIRESIPIHQISKIFYADTGKILNIGSEGESNNPVLLLKRDVNAIPPRRMMGRDETEEQYPEEGQDQEEDSIQSELDAQLLGEEKVWSQTPEAHSNAWRFPPGLDLEWIAFEVYQEEDDSDTETEAEEEGDGRGEPQAPTKRESVDTQLNEGMTKLNLGGEGNTQDTSPEPNSRLAIPPSSTLLPGRSETSNPLFNNIRTSLSLLETLLRLTSLQQFQQQSHLSITDELLNFFLEESSTTGAGGDEHHRRRVRAEARSKVGWDPYDESPLKRRGEEYQYQVNEEDHEEGGYYYTSTPQSLRQGRKSGSSRPSPAQSWMGGRGSQPGSPSPASSPSIHAQRREKRSTKELRRQIPVTNSSQREEGGPGSRRSSGIQIGGEAQKKRERS